MNYTGDDGKLAAKAMRILQDELPNLHEAVRLGMCRIVYQWGDENKKSGGKIVYGDCRRVPEWIKAFLPVDYVITLYENAMDLSEIGLERLLYHELLHVDWSPEKSRIRPHDTEDFQDCLMRWGQGYLFEGK